MKKALLIVALVLMLCGTARADMTLWALYDRQAAGVRAGYAHNEYEAGLFGAWPFDEENPGNLLGAYALADFRPLQIKNPIPVEWLPELITAKPYLGGYVTMDLREKDRKTLGGPMTGIWILDTFGFEWRYQFADGPLEDSFRDGEHIVGFFIKKRF